VADTASSSKGPLRAGLWIVVILACVATAFIWNSTRDESAPPRLALVTADQTPYWDLVIAGARAAAEEEGVALTVEQPDGSLGGQIAVIDRLLAEKYDGMAISPVDSVKQGITLRKVSATSRLVTVDSDSGVSGRICFVGADNYAAGRRCGELVKQALPDGGRIAIVMGPIDKENGALRRQGLIDELLDRSFGPGRPVEPMDQEHGNGAYTVVATLSDDIDPAAAEANVTALLNERSDIDGIVGLFGYSTPAALRALNAAGERDIAVVGFDDDVEMLTAVSDGRAHATIAQDQYNYGFHAVRLLAAAARGEDQALPITETVHFPPLIVTAENVETFRASRSRPSAGG